MKIAFYALLLIWSAMMPAQNGPLYIKNITLTPLGCTTPTNQRGRVNISVTGAGGTLSANGYIFTLKQGANVIETRSGLSVRFDNKEANTYTLEIQDSVNKVAYSITIFPSNSRELSFNVDSLPLGTGQGCITLSVAGPGGGTADFVINESTVTISKAPFSQTFASSVQNTPLNVFIRTPNDCGNVAGGARILGVPFPQGSGNGYNVYLYNKYCSCSLRPSTVIVPTQL